MNFRRKEPTLPPVDPVDPVDLDQIDRTLARPGERSTAGPAAYAQPHIRNDLDHPANQGWRINGPGPADPVVEQIETFTALPTKELDDTIAAAEANLANLKRDAQAVRDLYMKHTSRIIADVKRLHQGISFSIEMMNELREKVIALDSPPAKLPKAKVPPPPSASDDDPKSWPPSRNAEPST